jgi:hypothetical protein
MLALFALALVLNHARCVAACIADPCDQVRQQPSCHHHKSPEPKADRGCAFPAANDAQAAAPVQPAATTVVSEREAIAPPAPPAHPAVSSGDVAPGNPPGPASISILRI